MTSSVDLCRNPGAPSAWQRTSMVHSFGSDAAAALLSSSFYTVAFFPLHRCAAGFSGTTAGVTCPRKAIRSPCAAAIRNSVRTKQERPQLCQHQGEP